MYSSDDRISCLSVPFGMHVNPKTLLPEENKCTCEQGEGAEFEDCPVDGESRCIECNAGFTRVTKFQNDYVCIRDYDATTENVFQVIE